MSRINILGCVAVLLTLQAAARGGRYNGVEFPLGAASFADSVAYYDPLFSGGPAPDVAQQVPSRALGVPDSPLNVWDAYVPLGHGGIIVLEFVDNLLTNSGNSLPDLYIGEVIGTPEWAWVELYPTVESKKLLSPNLDPNGDGYYAIGNILAARRGGSEGFVALVDIDHYFPGFPRDRLKFKAVAVIDNPYSGSTSGGTVGMDLESVGCISAVVPEPPGGFLAIVGLVAMGTRRLFKMYV